MIRYRPINKAGWSVLLLPFLVCGWLQFPAWAESSPVGLDFTSGGVVVQGVASYAMNRCRLEDRDDSNRRLRLSNKDKFLFTVNYSEAPKEVAIEIEHSFSEDPSKVVPKAKPLPKENGVTSTGKPAYLSLYVNGELARVWEKFYGGYRTEKITVANLKEGANTFELRFTDPSASSSYWLRRIRL